MAIGDLVINQDKTSIGCVIGKHSNGYDCWWVSWTHQDCITYHYTQEIKEMRRRLKRYMEKNA